VPALSLAASLHLLVIVLRHRTPIEQGGVAAKEPIDETVSETPPGPVELGAVAQRPNRRLSAKRRAERLLRANPDMTAGQAAERLGLSRSHAARLLRAARTPRVVVDAGAGGP
jgi:hypothetical protein